MAVKLYKTHPSTIRGGSRVIPVKIAKKQFFPTPCPGGGGLGTSRKNVKKKIQKCSKVHKKIEKYSMTFLEIVQDSSVNVQGGSRVLPVNIAKNQILPGGLGAS